MSRELTEENLKEAYSKALGKVGIGAAQHDCDALMEKTVLVVVPQDMHDDFPERLLEAVTTVCTDEPYDWVVVDSEPEIKENTTFEDLFNDWFTFVINT